MAIIGSGINSFSTLGLSTLGGAFPTLGSGSAASPVGAGQALDLSQWMLQALGSLGGGWGSLMGATGGDNYASLEALGSPLSSQYAGITGVADVNTMIAQMGGLPSSTTTTATGSFANLDSSYFSNLMSSFDSQLNAAMAQYNVTGA